MTLYFTIPRVNYVFSILCEVHMDKNYKLIIILLLFIIILTGCTLSNDSVHHTSSNHKNTADNITTTSIAILETDSTYENITEIIEERENTETTSTGSSCDISQSIPKYSGDNFIELNNNNPEFTAEEKSCTEAFERYSNLDSKGRCGVAFANVCKELMPTEERGDIGDVKPSGGN